MSDNALTAPGYNWHPNSVSTTFDKSETIAKLAGALVAAQREVHHATKDATNPHFGSTYASLRSVIDAVRPVFGAHGICVLQNAGLEDGLATVETLLIHESGEWMACGKAAAPLTKQDAQGVGSAITYLRRYSLAAIAGIAQEDDDGNAAVSPNGAKAARPQPAPATAAWPPVAVPPARAGQAQVPEFAGTVRHTVEDEIACPLCHGAMWDNRSKKASGQFNPRSPDLSCKNKEGCGHAIWLDSWQQSLRRDFDGLVADPLTTLSQRESEELVAQINSLHPGQMQAAHERIKHPTGGRAAPAQSLMEPDDSLPF